MKQFLTVSMIGLLIGALSLGFLGCEAQTANKQISIEPSSATMHKGESVTFTASGGFVYTWSLSNGSIGTLSNPTGASITYTATASPSDEGTSNTLSQVLTCTSSIAGEGSSTTNASPGAWATEAYITQVE